MTISNDPIVIVSAVRTPMGGFQGELKSLTAPQLGAAAIRAAGMRPVYCGALPTPDRVWKAWLVWAFGKPGPMTLSPYVGTWADAIYFSAVRVAKGFGLAVLVGLLGFFAAATGLWVPAMQTLYLAGASTLVACAIGIPIGLWASRSTRVSLRCCSTTRMASSMMAWVRAASPGGTCSSVDTGPENFQP